MAGDDVEVHRTFQEVCLQVDNDLQERGHNLENAGDHRGAFEAFEASYVLTSSETSLVSMLGAMLKRGESPFLVLAGFRALHAELRDGDQSDPSLAAELKAVRRKLDEAEGQCKARRAEAKEDKRSPEELVRLGLETNRQGDPRTAYRYFSSAYAIESKTSTFLSMLNMKLKAGSLPLVELILRKFDAALDRDARVAPGEADVFVRKRSETSDALGRMRAAQLAAVISSPLVGAARKTAAAELAARMRKQGHEANVKGNLPEAHACFQAVYALLRQPADAISMANMKLKSRDLEGAREDYLDILSVADEAAALEEELTPRAHRKAGAPPDDGGGVRVAPPKGAKPLTESQRALIKEKLRTVESSMRTQGVVPRSDESFRRSRGSSPELSRRYGASARAAGPRFVRDDDQDSASRATEVDEDEEPEDAAAGRAPARDAARARPYSRDASRVGEPGVRAIYAAASSAGGSASSSGRALTRPNQDAYFAVESADGLVVGVLDGHGGAHGQVASQSAAAAAQQWFDDTHNAAALRRDAQAALAQLFLHCHVAVLDAMGKATGVVDRDRRWSSGGSDVDALVRTPLDAQTRLPAEGGTTATVVALVDGHLLLIAHVGDSDAVLGGEALDGRGISAEKLTADHTPCSTQEYVRTRTAASGDGAALDFVYDCPSADLLPVFEDDGRSDFKISAANAEKADLRGVGYKSVRAERPALIVAPPPKKGGPAPRLAVTRSLGDPHLQTCGLTWKPEVTLLDLAEPVQTLDPLVLIVGSDGLWDLWQYDEAIEEVIVSGYDLRTQQGVTAATEQLLAATKAKGEELLGDSTDDTTCVVLSIIKDGKGGARMIAGSVRETATAPVRDDDDDDGWA